MRKQELYLKDILSAIHHIRNFVENMSREDFLKDVKTQSGHPSVSGYRRSH